MKLVFIQTSTAPIPVHDKYGRLVRLVQDPPLLGFEVDQEERQAFPVGRLLRVRKCEPSGFLELEVVHTGDEP